MNLPPYKYFPHLTSRELLLREVREEDLPFLVEISFYDGRKAENISEAREMQMRIDKDYEHGESIHWVIMQKNSEKILGTCGYYRGFKGETGELGCILLPEFYGFGFMSRAMRMAIEFGFKKMELQRILAITSEENLPAQKLLQGLNFSLILIEGSMLHYELAAGKT